MFLFVIYMYKIILINVIAYWKVNLETIIRSELRKRVLNRAILFDILIIIGNDKIHKMFFASGNLKSILRNHWNHIIIGIM